MRARLTFTLTLFTSSYTLTKYFIDFPFYCSNCYPWICQACQRQRKVDKCWGIFMHILVSWIIHVLKSIVFTVFEHEHMNSENNQYIIIYLATPVHALIDLPRSLHISHWISYLSWHYKIFPWIQLQKSLKILNLSCTQLRNISLKPLLSMRYLHKDRQTRNN